MRGEGHVHWARPNALGRATRALLGDTNHEAILSWVAFKTLQKPKKLTLKPHPSFSKKPSDNEDVQ